VERNYEADPASSPAQSAALREREMSGAAFSIRPLIVQICYQAGAGAEIVTAVL